MRIVDVYLGQEIEEKILAKHSVLREEIEETLLADEPKYFKARRGRYLAIGFLKRFISAVYENRSGIAMIITAYPSSNWQISLYKRK